jgi:hypothetical protein
MIRVENGRMQYPHHGDQIVILNPAKVRHAHENNVSIGSTKKPHARRGHWRCLKSGRSVWVRNSKIHGGVEGDILYEVIKKSPE